MPTIEPNFPQAKHGLLYDTAPMVWDEALPLGNGMLGALVWGNGQPLNLSLDRADLWDLRPVPEYHSSEYSYSLMQQWHQEGKEADLIRLYEAPYKRPAPTKIPAGRIELTFGEGKHVTDMGLDIGAALATVNLADQSRLRVFVHATQPVGLLAIHPTGSVSFRLRSPAFGGEVKTAAEQADGIGRGDVSQLGYPAPLETSGFNWQAFSQQGAEGFQFAVYLGWREHNGELLAAWSIISSFAAAQPLEEAKRQVETALTEGFDPLFTRHKEWWNNFWRQSSVNLPDPLLERMWYLEQYKFGAVGRRGAPPITLQGIWTADDGQLPPWKGDYHHDLNTQLSYWPCYSGNHLEEGLGFLDWLWETRPYCREWTKQFFGLPGLNVPMTADLNNNQIGGWRQYTHSATTGAWLAHHFYLHWRYSADRDFLRDRAYPYLKEVATFIEAVSRQKDVAGQRTLPLSSSPEINDNRPEAWFSTLTNYDLALMRWLMEASSELASQLDLTDEAAHWQTILSELPNFALDPADGRLLIARNYRLPKSHRHLSHLLAIHPLGLLNWEDDPAVRRTIEASLSELETVGTGFWCGYTFAWVANLYARAKQADKAAQALTIFHTAFCLTNSFHCNGDQSGKGYSVFTLRPFTLEGNFAAASGLQEMLLQSYGGKIAVFPTVPASWRETSFTTLRAEGGFLISARRRNGQTQQVIIFSEQGGQCHLVSPFGKADLVLQFAPGERKVLDEKDY